MDKQAHCVRPHDNMPCHWMWQGNLVTLEIGEVKESALSSDGILSRIYETDPETLMQTARQLELADGKQRIWPGATSTKDQRVNASGLTAANIPQENVPSI